MTLREVKVVAGVVGMLVAVAGVMLGNRALVWVAIGVLGVAFLLRFSDRTKPPSS